MDWNLGSYEHVAAQLRPAAEVVIDTLAPAKGQHIVDLGCGTGNAALLIADRGVQVTGVDPSPRLLEVARREAINKGVVAEFVLGQADAIPCGDGSADAIASVFGVIFAPDAEAAAAEMARVLAPRGRIVLSAWIPGCAIGRQAAVRRRAVAAALGETAAQEPFAWHDPRALALVLEPHGFSTAVQEFELAFTAPSVQSYAEGEWRHHPLWVEARSVLEPRGRWTAVCDEALQVLVDANEDPGAFRVTSGYVIVTASRGDAPSPGG